MMTRGEAALIIARKAPALGVLDSKYFTAVIPVIIVSSIVTPVALKLAFKEKMRLPDKICTGIGHKR